jgi:hypothetical protein
MVLSQRDLKILIAGGSSDSHGWNLVFLEPLLEESGHRVVNLGPCVGGRLGMGGVRDGAAARRLIAAGYAAAFDDADVSAFLDRVSRLAERGWCGLSAKCAP